jgi:hypothetical protein
MQREEVLDAWAPPSGAWSLWVHPVPFAQMSETILSAAAPTGPAPWLGLDVAWAPGVDERSLLILDLPGAESVYVGVALAQRGYRPVPLFNACTGPRELVEQGRIHRALHDGAADLRSQDLRADAPPAFLLDELRSTPVQSAQPTCFDNRWRVYPEDLPSTDVLRARGLERAILVRHCPRGLADDLRLVLWQWQEAGFVLAVKDLNDSAAPQPLTVARPSWLRRTWEGLLHSVGVRRSPKGGFGYVIPEPTHG